MSSPDEQIAQTAQAFGHPARVAILRALHERGEAGPVDLAPIIGQPLGTVAYHVRILAQLGAIDVARTEPRRGAVKHFYVLSPVMQVKLNGILKALS